MARLIGFGKIYRECFDVIVGFSLVANTRDLSKDLIPVIDELVLNAENEDDDIIQMAKLFSNNLENNNRLDEVLLDETIEKFIDDKIDKYKNGEKNKDEVKEEILEEIDKKLTQLNYNDEDLKKYLTGIISGVIDENSKKN